MTHDPRAILLASGGLDSTTLAYKLLADRVDFVPIFINYGQHCADTELKTLRFVLPPSLVSCITVLDVSDVYRGSKSRLIVEPDLWKEQVEYKELYLPYRSLLLLSIGAAYAQANEYSILYAGFINSNHAQEIDCSAGFFAALDAMLADYGGVELRMPFRFLSKLEIAKLGLNLGTPIGKTFSCQVSSDIPCGACPNCVDRLDALEYLLKK